MALMKLGVTEARDAATNKRAVDVAVLAAARDGTLANVEFLFKTGADIDTKTEYGMNVLHVAVARSKRRSLVEYLLERRIKLLEERNPDGDTPFLAAVRHGHMENVEALLFAGAELYAEDKEGRNAVAIAADMGHHALHTFLLEQFRLLEEARELKRQAERERDEMVYAQRQAEKARDDALEALRKADMEMAEAIRKQTAAEVIRDDKLSKMHEMEEERDKALECVSSYWLVFVSNLLFLTRLCVCVCVSLSLSLSLYLSLSHVCRVCRMRVRCTENSTTLKRSATAWQGGWTPPGKTWSALALTCGIWKRNSRRCKTSASVVTCCADD